MSDYPGRLSDCTVEQLQQMLLDAQRTAGADSKSAKIIRSALEQKAAQSALRPTCATCPHWSQFMDDTHGRCRRNPPIVVYAGGAFGSTGAERPSVAANQYCGERLDFPAWVKATRAHKGPMRCYSD